MKVTGPMLNDRQTLLDRAMEAGLLSAAQRSKAEAVLPSEATTATQAAHHLVQTGLLTRFQAERLLAGRVEGFVLGQYVIEDAIGRGPVGRVYKARHRTMNRHVAIKVLASEISRQPHLRQLFHDGVRAAARLNHPNIVTTYDANEVGERLYVVLEFVDGPSLNHLIQQRGPVPWTEACEIIRQATQGLQHAHSNGMTHRNLTPGNVLLSRSAKGGGLVKLTDFGLTPLSPIWRTSPSEQTPLPPAYAGHLPFIAPDRTECSISDPRIDLYSLGALFYLLVAGRPPADGASELPPNLPPAITHIISTLLAPHAADRVASTHELLGLLASFSQRLIPFHADYAAISFDNHQPTAADSLTGFGRNFSLTDSSPWSEIVADNPDHSAETFSGQDAKGTTPFSLPSAESDKLYSRTDRYRKGLMTNHSSIVPLIVVAISICILCLLATVALLRIMG